MDIPNNVRVLTMKFRNKILATSAMYNGFDMSETDIFNEWTNSWGILSNRPTTRYGIDPIHQKSKHPLNLDWINSPNCFNWHCTSWHSGNSWLHARCMTFHNPVFIHHSLKNHFDENLRFTFQIMFPDLIHWPWSTTQFSRVWIKPDFFLRSPVAQLKISSGSRIWYKSDSWLWLEGALRTYTDLLCF